jgi:putative ABC transport system permease protein
MYRNQSRPLSAILYKEIIEFSENTGSNPRDGFVPAILGQHLRFALRQLRRNPGFTVAAVVTLALGMSTTTAIFSVVNGIILSGLSFPHSEQLVAIDTLEFPEGAAGTNPAAASPVESSYPDFFDWRNNNHTFQGLACSWYVSRLFSKINGGGARVIPGARVSANLFSTLGVPPVWGRWFTPEEELPGHRVVMLSYELWVSEFASSPDAIGQTVLISDEPSTIVGVMPRDFHFPVDTPAYFWTTFAVDAEGVVPDTSVRGWGHLFVIGRMMPGTQVARASADLNMIQARLASTYPENRSRPAVSLSSLLDESVSEVRSALTFLLAAAGALLLIGCTNVAGLFLARMNGRRPELALRTALGASRPRILVQLLLEASLVAFVGAVFGILFALVLLRVGLRFIPDDFPRLYNIAIDERVFVFALLLSAGTTFVFGLLPAWSITRPDPGRALREGGFNATGSARRNRHQSALVIIESALSFTLLVGSGLLIRTVVNILKLEPGFDRQHTVAFDIALTQKRYPDPNKLAYFEKLIPQLAALPGVENVSVAHPLPLQGRDASESFIIPGHPTSPDNPPTAISAVAMPEYFETLSIPLLRGRTFTPHDVDPKSAPIAVINRSLARAYFPAEDPIGRYLIPNVGGSRVPRLIVGIVGDTRTGNLWNPYQPEFFLPYAQEPTHQRPLVVMKVMGDPSSYEDRARKIIAQADPEAPLFRYRTLSADTERQAIQPRFEAWVVSIFATVALMLSAVGLYAVLSYLVTERTRELGLRMALGATRGNLVKLVLSRGVGLSFTGIAAGFLVSYCASHLATELLFNVAPLDLAVFFTATVVLMSVSLVSALIPALRAASIEPMRCLRAE